MDAKSIFHLPLEIRQQILEYVLDTAESPPQDPWTGEEQRESRMDIQYKSWSTGPRWTLYPITEEGATAPLKALDLFLVNRQFYADMCSLIDRLKAPYHASYHLDVMVVHGYQFCPTWTLIPVQTTHLNEVAVTFRLFGSHLPLKASRGMSGCDGSNGPEWCFLALLERFVAYGPTGKRDPTQYNSKHGPPSQYFIGNLVLDVVSCADELYPLPVTRPSPQQYRDYYRPYSRKAGDFDLEKLAIPPEKFADDLCSEISGLLHLGYHRQSYGEILYEQIGTSEVRIGGQVHRRFNLSELLAKRTYHGEGATLTREERTVYFWKWKKKALEKRDREGLPVIWSQDPEFDIYP